MGTVVAFKRPEPAPAKPPEPEDTRVVFIAKGGKKIVAFYRDQFDKNTRYLFDAETSTAERQDFLNRWRANCGFEVLECMEARCEN